MSPQILIKPKDTRKYAGLSPFQLKDQLIQLASSHAERMMLNVGRGTPNWLATTPRAGFFQLGLFAVEDSQQGLSSPHLGDMPERAGIAQRLSHFLSLRSGLAGISFLNDCLIYGEDHLGLDADDSGSEDLF